MGFFRKNLSNDLVPIDPDNISNKDWVILLEAGTIAGPSPQRVRASGGGRRVGQRHLTPLVGRDEEIAMLMRWWERAREGDGQLVLIVGEPGRRLT